MVSDLARLSVGARDGWIRGAVFFLMPSVMAFAPKWVPLILVAGAIYEGVLLVAKRTPVPRSIVIPALSFGALVLWAALSALWSLTPVDTLEKTAVILGLGVCGLVLLASAANYTEAHRRIVARSMTFGTILLALQIAFEVVGGGVIAPLLHPADAELGLSALIRMKPAASVLAILVWPATVVLWRHVSRIAAAVLVVGSMIVIVEVSAYAAFVAVIAGGIVFGCAAMAQTTTARTLSLLLLAVAVAAPLIVSTVSPGPWLKKLPDAMEFTAYHRLAIWEFTDQMVAERPILGWGLRASRSIPGGDETADVNRDLEYDPPRFDSEPSLMPLHPHNVFLQVWLELGLVGIALFLALTVPIPIAVGRAKASGLRAAGVLASIGAAAIIACLSFGIWQSWWMAVLWIVAGQSVAVGRNGHDDTTVLTR